MAIYRLHQDLQNVSNLLQRFVFFSSHIQLVARHTCWWHWRCGEGKNFIAGSNHISHSSFYAGCNFIGVFFSVCINPFLISFSIICQGWLKCDLYIMCLAIFIQLYKVCTDKEERLLNIRFSIHRSHVTFNLKFSV